ncbi:MAG: hypothetical protein JSS34_05165 [Proteobacteria bacterium]|nr:hypothetical protein [Pseudomonadota bacterium]
MKTLSKVCSVLLLGTSLISGSSFAMSGGAAAAEEERTPRTYGPAKSFYIKNHYSAKALADQLSDSLEGDTLSVRIDGHIFSQQVRKVTSDSFDDAAVINDFFANFGKPWTYKHAVYSLPEAAAQAASRRTGSQLSPRCVHIVNAITSSIDIEGIEKERGTMVRPVSSLLSLCPQLEALTLRLLTVDRLGVDALQATGRLSSLRSLSLTLAHMGDKEVATLFSTGSFPVLGRVIN